MSEVHELQARLETLEAREQQRAKRTRVLVTAGIACIFATPFAARALGAVPNVFSSGSPIVAADINANFTHVVAGVTAVEARATALEGRLSEPITAERVIVRRSGRALSAASAFIGRTTAALTGGGVGGYPGGRAACALEFGASAHMCTTEEVLRSAQLAVLPATGASAWFSSGVDCASWTTTSSTLSGQTWVPVNNQIEPSSCNNNHPVLCCD